MATCRAEPLATGSIGHRFVCVVLEHVAHYRHLRNALYRFSTYLLTYCNFFALCGVFSVSFLSSSYVMGGRAMLPDANIGRMNY